VPSLSQRRLDRPYFSYILRTFFRPVFLILSLLSYPSLSNPLTGSVSVQFNRPDTKFIKAPGCGLVKSCGHLRHGNICCAAIRFHRTEEGNGDRLSPTGVPPNGEFPVVGPAWKDLTARSSIPFSKELLFKFYSSTLLGILWFTPQVSLFTFFTLSSLFFLLIPFFLSFPF